MYTRELTNKERCEIALKQGWMGENVVRDGYDWEETIHVLNNRNIPTRAISLMWNQRSVDAPLGLPFNVASYGLLLEIIAKMVNMVPDELIGNLGDCHIYSNQLDGVREQITREPYALPKLHVNDEFWATENDVKHYDINVLINSMLIEDFQIEGYQSHPSIKMPLSN
jgi:thymidylate synthase